MTNQAPHLERKAFMWLFLILILLGAYVVYPFLMTLVVSVVLAVLFHPFHRFYMKKTKGRKGLSSFFSVFTVILLLIIPATVAMTLVTAQVAALIQKFPNTFSEQGVTGVLLHWKNYISPLVEKVEGFFGAKFDFVDLVRQGIQYVAQYLAQYSPEVILRTANFFLHLFIMLIVLFYLFRDGDELFKKVMAGCRREETVPSKADWEQRWASGKEWRSLNPFFGGVAT